MWEGPQGSEQGRRQALGPDATAGTHALTPAVRLSQEPPLPFASL